MPIMNFKNQRVVGFFSWQKAMKKRLGLGDWLKACCRVLMVLLTMVVCTTAVQALTWTSRTSAANNSWTGATYGNGLFVAVSRDGTGNRVMTSPDGITWTPRTSAADSSWSHVTYGNGLFVAVADSGSGNRVMTSPDGINWTGNAAASNINWGGVTYGNGLFVAVAYSGSGGRVMTSPDGVNWTLSAPTQVFSGVTYGNGLFVAVIFVGSSGQRVMTSPDGITWTPRTSAADNPWRSVTYGNGLFVAVSDSGSGNRVMTSPDGVTWTIRASAANNAWRSVTYGNGLFVAVSDSGAGNRVMTSPDGINWSTDTTPDNSWQSVSYGNGLFVAVSDWGSNRVMTGVNSQPQTITFSNPGSQNFGTTPTLTATSTSSLAVSFTSSTTSVCTITSAGALTFVTTGTCTINGNQAGDASYLAASTVTQSFTVNVVVPGAPTVGVATAGNAQASVAFTAPAANGGASITGYTVTSNPGGLTGTGTSSPITVTGLTNGTAYTFTVTATNSAGTSTASAASNSVTPVLPSVAGTCGSANAQTFAFVPVANLCTAGTASVVASANGQFTWSCNGSGGGSNASCAANWTSTGGNNTGMVSVPSNSNNNWALDTSSVNFTPARGANNSPATPPPANYMFPQGLASFNLTSGTAGSNATVTIHYTEAIPVGAVYMKYGRTQSSPTTDVWYPLAANRVSFSNDRKSVTLTLTDGGEGDHDRTANSTIVDPGGPALDSSTAQAIPTLSEWAMLFMAALMAMLGYTRLRSRRL
jgi:predicted RecA/RadA family phage recombinase